MRTPDLGDKLITKVRSLYLRYERKYDRWGAQGKILAAMEVFRDEGVEMDEEQLLAFVNEAFPRTFVRGRQRAEAGGLPPRALLRSTREDIRELLARHGLRDDRLDRTALEETAERFGLDPEFLKGYLE